MTNGSINQCQAQPGTRGQPRRVPNPNLVRPRRVRRAERMRRARQSARDRQQAVATKNSSVLRVPRAPPSYCPNTIAYAAHHGHYSLWRPSSYGRVPRACATVHSKAVVSITVAPGDVLSAIDGVHVGTNSTGPAALVFGSGASGSATAPPTTTAYYLQNPFECLPTVEATINKADASTKQLIPGPGSVDVEIIRSDNLKAYPQCKFSNAYANGFTGYLEENADDIDNSLEISHNRYGGNCVRPVQGTSVHGTELPLHQPEFKSHYSWSLPCYIDPEGVQEYVSLHGGTVASTTNLKFKFPSMEIFNNTSASVTAVFTVERVFALPVTSAYVTAGGKTVVESRTRANNFLVYGDAHGAGDSPASARILKSHNMHDVAKHIPGEQPDPTGSQLVQHAIVTHASTDPHSSSTFVQKITQGLSTASAVADSTGNFLDTLGKTYASGKNFYNSLVKKVGTGANFVEREIANAAPVVEEVEDVLALLPPV